MGNMRLTFLPPQNWQDFETLIRGVVDVIWRQEGWQNYGRPGQTQSGIDLYGYDDKRLFTGIQCKKKNQTDSEGVSLTNSLLTKQLIDEEIKNSESIKNPSLERFIFATTSSRDKKIQDLIREINHDRIKSGKFSVNIWFWEDIQILIENHIELMYWYYQDYLEKIQKYDKNIHILTMLRQAFARPAFHREIRMEESGADFIQAIKDTQEAIMTGRLHNRRGELLTTSYNYQKLNNKEWKTEIKVIYDKLDSIRIIYLTGLLEKRIREHPTCLEVLDFRISEQFNKIRTDCLIGLNKVLKESGLEIIKSELLRN
jgi:hypothetical protein